MVITIAFGLILEALTLKILEAKKVLPLSELHLHWIVDQISEPLTGSSDHFFLRSVKAEGRVIRLSKFRANPGWILRCVVWPSSGGRFFIHIPTGPV